MKTLLQYAKSFQAYKGCSKHFGGLAFLFITREKVSGFFDPQKCYVAYQDLGHRHDLTTLSSREAFRSQNNTSGLGIGYPGPLGRFMVRGEEGHDTIPELYPVPGEPIIDKPGRGAFSHTDFELLLRNKGIQNLAIAGIATDGSISSTIREASDRGFDCLLIEDGCAAKDAKLQKGSCESIAMGGGAFGATGKLHHIAGQLEYIAHERRNGLEHGMMPQAPM